MPLLKKRPKNGYGRLALVTIRPVLISATPAIAVGDGTLTDD